MVETIVPSNNIKHEILSAYCSVYTMTGDGDSSSTVYTIFPGVSVVYNDFHTAECNSNLRYTDHVISIDHCAEGCIEWEHDDGSFCYLLDGDIQISAKTDHLNRYGFPVSHYHGVTVNFFLPQAQESLKRAFPSIDLDWESLWRRCHEKRDVFIRRSESTVQSFFQDLYRHRENADPDVLKLKIMELLLFITKTELTKIEVQKPYFHPAQVRKVRAIKEYLCENTDRMITTAELSADFDLSLSALRSCFKAIYGQPVNTFIRQYRLQKAALLLRTGEMSVTDVALEVGYESLSKFISVFKAVYGTTPLKHRKQNKETEHF
ncbi:MAG: AraC family transcriptional regulator [Oscillospiraceae bacterium]|jgi:AraC-like DNA-binding protein|nr:AraC family transcriptional regulator [Oscillospiraceae bacterium]